MGLYCGWGLSRFVEFSGDIMWLFDFGNGLGWSMVGFLGCVSVGGFQGLCLWWLALFSWIGLVWVWFV